MVLIYDNNKRAWVQWPIAAMVASILGCASTGATDGSDRVADTAVPERNETDEALRETTPPEDDCDWLPSVDGFFYCNKKGTRRADSTDKN